MNPTTGAAQANELQDID